MTEFICIATIRTMCLDTCNREEWRQRETALRATELGALYEQIAKARIRHTWSNGDEDCPDERSTIAFGPIHLVASSEPLDESRLAATPTWTAHAARLEAERVEAERLAAMEEAEEQEAERLRVLAREAEDLATYERIKARLEGGGTGAGAGEALP
jgi:hypothetical protein